MKKSISFIVLAVTLLFSSFGTVWAQTSIGPPNLIWEKMTSTEYPISSFTILPGNKYVTGYYNYYPANCKLVSYDSNGSIVWQKGLWAQPLDNSMITLESENAFALILRDSVYKFDYNGNIISSFKIPITSECFSIYKSDNYYVIIEGGNGIENPNLFLYDINWNLLRFFPVKGNVGSAVIRDDVIYIASSYAAYGVHSNGSSRLSKYNLLTGEETFSLLFPDLFHARLCLNSAGDIYFAAFRIAPEAPKQFWEVKKVSVIGDILWSKNWLGDMPAQPLLGLWVRDIVILGDQGCLVIGAATKLNQGTGFDVNNHDPIGIAFKPDGEINWKYRYTSRVGSFLVAKFDYNNNLLMTCYYYLNSNSTYALVKLSLPGLTAIKDINSEIPDNFSLSQNYPNPFNPSTIINFSVKQVSFVSLKVYDVIGKEVAILVAEELASGNYQYTFLADDNLPSGVYLYRLEAGNSVLTRKMLFLK